MQFYTDIFLFFIETKICLCMLNNMILKSTSFFALLAIII